MNQFKLSNGVELPQIALGPAGIGYNPRPASLPQNRLLNLGYRAWRKFIIRPNERKEWINSVAYAFKEGYRLIDNSATYGNMDALKEAIDKSGLRREEIILTTRIDNRTQAKGEKAIRAELETSLKWLGTDYIDILQFHWPVPEHYLATWRVMEQLYREGKCRVIGVANCHEHHLRAIFDIAEIQPQINQIEVHPLFTQKPLIEFCKQNDIQVQSYTPIARFDDRLMRLPVLRRIAQAQNKTIVQVILRWHVQQGLLPVVRSKHPSRINENFEIFDFSLSPDEMDRIDAININARVRYDPDNCDFSIL
ncbi:MAG: aldo/keto reductase [Bacteroidales bacterium]|nr:aldo/keto reductase [Bacteroidales bacterium]